MAEHPQDNLERMATWLRRRRRRFPEWAVSRPVVGAVLAVVMVSAAALVVPRHRDAAAAGSDSVEAAGARTPLEAQPKAASRTAETGAAGTGRGEAPRGRISDGVRASTPAALPPVTAASYRVGIAPIPESERVAKPEAVHGIYLNAWAAGSSRKLAKLLALADRTEINTFVVDVKDASGHVSYGSTVPLANQVGSPQRRIHDIRALLAELKAHGIYPIARIVAFKDPVLAKARPDWALRDTTGAIWKDRYGDMWVDAFDKRVWDYDIALAREAVSLGFAEVQWDYVRFPDTPARLMKAVVFPARDGRTKADAIREFLKYSRHQLAELHVPVTADVFGLTTSAGNDMGIGQFWPKMVDATDVLLPMVYPSHYVHGSYGFRYPNGNPYEIVKTALEHAITRSRGVGEPASIRPWLQDFTLGQPRYGAAEVRAQIQAVYDAGLREWVLWNAGADYTADALAPSNGAAPSYPIPHWAPEPEPDSSGALLGEPMPPDTGSARRP